MLSLTIEDPVIYGGGGGGNLKLLLFVVVLGNFPLLNPLLTPLLEAMGCFSIIFVA